MLVMTLVLSCTSSTSFLRDSIAARRVSVSPTQRQHLVDLLAQRGDVVAVRLDVLQVRLAAGADLVDAGDFLAHRLDDRVALGERGDLGVDLLGQLRQLAGARLERGDPLLRERELACGAARAAFDAVFEPLELILGRFELRGDVALAALHARELLQQLVLDHRRAADFLGQPLHLLERARAALAGARCGWRAASRRGASPAPRASPLPAAPRRSARAPSRSGS